MTKKKRNSVTQLNHLWTKFYIVTIQIGTLRSEDGDGRENVAEKVDSFSFNLYRDYSKSLASSNVGEPS